MVGIPFPKGNQFGRFSTKSSPDIKVMRDICRDKIVEAAHQVCSMGTKELADFYRSDNATTLQRLLGNAINKNNMKFVQFVLEQAVGKAKQQIEVDDSRKTYIIEDLKKAVIGDQFRPTDDPQAQDPDLRGPTEVIPP